MSSASLSEVGYSTVLPPSLLYDPFPAHIYVTTDRLDDDDYLIPPKSSLIYTLPPPRFYVSTTFSTLSVRCFWPLSPTQYL